MINLNWWQFKIKSTFNIQHTCRTVKLQSCYRCTVCCICEIQIYTIIQYYTMNICVACVCVCKLNTVQNYVVVTFLFSSFFCVSICTMHFHIRMVWHFICVHVGSWSYPMAYTLDPQGHPLYSRYHRYTYYIHLYIYNADISNICFLCAQKIRHKEYTKKKKKN